VTHQLIIIPGAVHSIDLQPQQLELRPTLLKFLDEHLKSPALVKYAPAASEAGQWHKKRACALAIGVLMEVGGRAAS